MSDMTLGEKYIEILRRLRRVGPKKMALELYPDSPNPRGAFDSLILRIKRHYGRCRWFVNCIEAITRNNSYIKKRLMVVGEEWADDEEI